MLVSVCWDRFEDLCKTYKVSVPRYFRVRRTHIKKSFLTYFQISLLFPSRTLLNVFDLSDENVRCLMIIRLVGTDEYDD